MLNYLDSFIKDILTTTQIIAVVGISAKDSKPSHSVAQYLLTHGYTIVPVNPVLESVLGQKCYPSLRDIPFKVDMVDCFRAIEYIPALVDEAIEIGAQTVWMQLGLEDPESCKRAESKGLRVIQNLCTKIEHQRLLTKSL